MEYRRTRKVHSLSGSNDCLPACHALISIVRILLSDITTARRNIFMGHFCLPFLLINCASLNLYVTVRRLSQNLRCSVFTIWLVEHQAPVSIILMNRPALHVSQQYTSPNSNGFHSELNVAQATTQNSNA
jgi:hypothetical protein